MRIYKDAEKEKMSIDYIKFKTFLNFFKKPLEKWTKISYNNIDNETVLF